MGVIVLKGVITPEGQLQVELPPDLPPGPVEVEIRQTQGEIPSVRLGDLLENAPTGLWEDIDDSVEFARQLRNKASRRRSMRGYYGE